MSSPADLEQLQRSIELCAAEIETGRPPSQDYLRRYLAWGLFPRRLRRLYIAQRGRCSLCGALILPDLLRDHPAAGSEDHIVPRFLDGKGLAHNKLLAHRRCNTERGFTPPTPELVAFAAAVHARLERYHALVTAESAKRGYPPPGTRPAAAGHAARPAPKRLTEIEEP